MRRALALAAVALLAAGCASVPTRTMPKPAPESRPHALPFVEDDYARALADARARSVPLFVEAWAPW
jgi:uncharacterized protein YceK